MSPRPPQQQHLIGLDFMVDEAIDFIKTHEPPEGYFVGFSGGKDSIVLLEIVRMAGVKHAAYYSATGIDPPEVCKFIRTYYPDVKWLKPKMSFWEGIYKNAPPLRIQRWCCDVLKKDPAKHIPLSHRLMGLRAEESVNRAGRPRVDYFKKYKQHLYKPIFNFMEWHIWEFIESNNLPYPSLYDEGFHRIGCVICPYMCHKNQTNMDLHKKLWPTYYKTFEHAVTRWWNAKRSQSNFDDSLYSDETPGQYLDKWYHGFE